MGNGLPLRDALFSFVPNEGLRGALFLTYSFDGRWFEEAIVPGLLERPIDTMLVIRDRNALSSEAPSVRYRKANACLSSVFHPKLALLVSEHHARAIIGSANLTRGSFERQRELGRVYDLNPEASDELALFRDLQTYLQQGVATEVRGDSHRDLLHISKALGEVIARCGEPTAASTHRLFHSYDRPIWEQVLAVLPHRVLDGALVMSPFFEADKTKPEDPPADETEARSIFETQLFDKFEFPKKGEPPLKVFFRSNAGKTELPVAKLRTLKGRATFFEQSDLDQRLHAKLVVLEGAGGGTRAPYLRALHGSPNFTSAGLVRSVPYGNSELAVLTTLPAKRKSMDGVVKTLGLQSFVRVEDISKLANEPTGDPPRPVAQGLADVTFNVARRTLRVVLIKPALKNTFLRVLLERDGQWTPIAEGDVSSKDEITLPAKGVLETDEHTKLLELRGSVIRIELIGADGSITSSDGPLNVAIPGEFCGLTRVGGALATLDERIARAGTGLPPTYREQQQWLEGRKAAEPGAANSVSTHQADLDRFYRNIHHGLRGILARFRASSDSEFTLRRTLRDLAKWCIEATDESNGKLTPECRLYLVDRLARALRTVIEHGVARDVSKVSTVAAELGLPDQLHTVAAWLASLGDLALSGYVSGTKLRLDAAAAMLPVGAAT